MFCYFMFVLPEYQSLSTLRWLFVLSLKTSNERMERCVTGIVLFNQSAAHDVFNYLRVPDKEWNSKSITVSNIDDNLHVKAHKQSVCCTILLLTLKSSQVAGTEYNWCAALQILGRLGCSDLLTWNSRGCFWWWKRPWTWKTPFRRYNGTHHPTQTLGAEAGKGFTQTQSCGRFSANLSKRILCREHGFPPT